MSGNCPAPQERDLAKIVLAIRDLFCGRGNHAGSFTCALSVATTVVKAANCGAASQIMLTPTTANAATELGNGTIYVSAKAAGQFTVTHANSATTGRTFDYAICS
jgi:2-methylaconitate cis-trans-isomerase PrpF